MIHNSLRIGVCASALAAFVPAQAADPYTYKIVGISNTAPANFPAITFSVIDTATGTPANIRTDPAWTQTANGNSRLFFQIAWNTREIHNTDSMSNSVPGGRGAAMPIPVNALAANDNGNGTYTATSPLAIPATAAGSGQVVMEGHPAGKDAAGAWTLRVPVRSVFAYFTITDASPVPRRQIVSAEKCMGCHRTDGAGRAPRLAVHGNNRSDEPQACVVCHNVNNTDIPFRGLITNPVTDTNPTVVVARYTYPEQSIDFKRLVHGIHASSKGFRRNPLAVVSFNGSIFNASQLEEYPASLKNCVNCHIDDGARGTFELQPSGPPLGPFALGSTMNTLSENNARLANGTFVVNTDPADNVRISPAAAACSSCHDDRETVSHMVRTGGASFNTTQASLDLGVVRERCNVCHGPNRERSVRKVHGISGGER